MRVMAIGTLHDAFIHAMFERHGELSADRAMATVAKLILFLREQKLWFG